MPSLDTVRRSMLKTEIQASLLKEPARSITELAERVQSPRPSVSRALKALKEQGIVEQRGRTWHLTAKGETSALEDVQAHVVSAGETAAAMARKMMGAQALGESVFGQVRDAYLGSMSDLLSLNAASFVSYQDLLGPAIDSSTLDAALGRPLERAQAMVGFGIDSEMLLGDHGLASEGIASAALGALATDGLASLLTMETGLQEMAAQMSTTLMTELDGLNSPFANATLGALAGSEVLSSQLLSVESGIHALAETMKKSLMPDLGNLIAPMISAQDHLVACLEAISPPSSMFPMDSLLEQTSAFATMLENAAALDSIGSYLAAAGKIRELADIAWAPEQLLSVSGALGSLYEWETTQLQKAIVSASQFQPDFTWTLAAEPVSNYSLSTRYWLEAQTDYDVQRDSPSRSPRVRNRFEEQTDLDERLRRLSPHLVEMRQGGWYAIERGGPDYIRHAGTSHREFLDHFLRELVPSNLLPEGERQGAQIKARMRIVLGRSKRSSAEWVEAMANALYFSYERLCSATHGSTGDEASLVALMKSTEGLIDFISVNIDLDQKH